MSNTIVVKEENAVEEQFIVILPEDFDLKPEVANEECGKVEVPEVKYELVGSELVDTGEEGNHDLQTDNPISTEILSHNDILHESCQYFKCIMCAAEKRIVVFPSYEKIHFHLEITHQMATHKLRENLIECEHEESQIHCRLCGEMFVHGALLHQHLEMHLKEQQFNVISQTICLICGHTSGKVRGLHQHMLRSHAMKDDQERMRQMTVKVTNASDESDCEAVESMMKSCKFCQKVFNGAKSLREHQLRAHSDLVSPEDFNQKYNCAQCKSTFPSVFALSNHVKQIHRSIFLCAICCDKLSAVDIAGVRAHYEMHNDELMTSSAPKRPRIT